MRLRLGGWLEERTEGRAAPVNERLRPNLAEASWENSLGTLAGTMAGKVTDSAERLHGPGDLAALDLQRLREGRLEELPGGERDDGPSLASPADLVTELKDPPGAGTKRHQNRLQVQLGKGSW